MVIRYTVSVLHPHTKYYKLELAIDDITTDSVTLKFPAWSPGSYKVRDYAKNVSSFDARDRKGNLLKWSKTSKGQWDIQTAGAQSIRISYRIHGCELSVQGVYLDHRFGFFNGPSLFFYSDAWKSLPIDVIVRAPKEWKLATGLRQISPFHYRAQDIDDLYDCPMLMSKDLTVHHFKVANTPHRAVFFGDAQRPTAELVKDIARIVRTETRLFGGAPYRDYTFLILFMPDMYGGLEHRNSSANLFDGALLQDKEKYTEFLALLSHEFFHTWNVKRIRPNGLGPFDYSQETYTRELWIAEGITSYYDDHLLVRSGLLTEADYCSKVLTKTIERYENQPAKATMSLSESSFDAWIKLYQPTENAPNTIMSYYLKGGLVTMLLDMEMLRLSRGRKSLDDVMRLLWKRYQKHPEQGVSREDFDDAVFSIMGDTKLRRFLRDHVDRTKPIAWRTFLKPFGLTLKPKKEKAAPYTGFTVMERYNRLYVEKVIEQSPAYHSALQPADELIAFDGIRHNKEKGLTDLVKTQTIGSTHRILFCRQKRVEETTITLQQTPEFRFDVVYADTPKRSEKYLRDCFFRKRLSERK